MPDPTPLKRLRLEDLGFKEQLSSKSVLFERIPPAEPPAADAQLPAADGSSGQQDPARRRAAPRAPGLLFSMDLHPPPLDEPRARELLALALEAAERAGASSSGSRTMKADSSVSSGAAAVQKVCGGGGEGEGKTGSQGAEWPALKVEQSFENDRYRKFVAPGFCSASFEVVYPAEFKDVVKKRAVPLLRVKETKELYDAVTVPRMIANAAQKDAWVELILDGQKEAENVIFEDAEIMLVKDYKWQDEANLNELKYLVLFKDKTIRSLRDLDGDRHLELLERVQLEGEAKVIEKHFGIMLGTGAAGVGAQAADGGDEAEGSEKCQGGATAPPQLMSYFHYHPTFWYLHVHICSTRHSMFENEEGLLLTDRLVKLDTVVDVLRVSPKYYEAATLTTALREPVAAWYGVR